MAASPLPGHGGRVPAPQPEETLALVRQPEELDGAAHPVVFLRMRLEVDLAAVERGDRGLGQCTSAPARCKRGHDHHRVRELRLLAPGRRGSHALGGCRALAAHSIGEGGGGSAGRRYFDGGGAVESLVAVAAQAGGGF